jgi:hypothetical protein
MFENKFQILFLYSLFSDFKKINFKPYFYYANKVFWPIYKVSLKFGFNMKSVFLTVLQC